MISLAIFLTSLLVALGILFATRDNMKVLKGEGGKYERHEFNWKWITTPCVIFIVGLLLTFLQPFSLERVDAGHVGIKVNLTGNDRGVSDYTYKTGWVTYNVWTEKLYEFPTYQQHIEYDTIDVITKGGFSAKIKPSFNYNLISTSVGDMFVNLRLNVNQIEQGWLKNAIYSSVNDVVNKWSIDDIFNDREKFEQQIIIECNKRVSKWFLVGQLRSNITPPPALQAAINNKTKAIQDAQAEMQKALVADAQAKVKIANARGDSAQAVITASGKANSTVIEAKGEADAMKLKQNQITPLYIEYIKVSNWNGQNPTTVLGNSNTAVMVK